MKRRTFLQGSAAGLGLASLDGCAMMGADEHRFQGVDKAHLVFDGDSPEFRLHPTKHQTSVVDDAGSVGRSFGKLGSGLRPGEAV